MSADTLLDIDLAPSKQVLQNISALGRLDEAFVQTHTIIGLYPHWLPDWVTLRPAAWNTSEQRPVLPRGVLHNFCSACLREDLDGGGQFIRIEWLCAATTICVRHLVPLRGLQLGNPPFECRHTGVGARFFSYPSHQLLDAELTVTNTMIALAAKFEQNIRAGLNLSYGASHGVLEEKAREVIAAVEDLAWALLQIVGTDATRVIHCLQSASFPVPAGWRTWCPIETLSRADVGLRRSIFAVIACLLQPEQFGELGRSAAFLGRPHQYSDLLRILGADRSERLLSRSDRWPLRLREALERAAPHRRRVYTFA